MNTTKLVVGQDIYMVSGVYMGRGKVVDIMSWGVEVKITADSGSTGTEHLYFDRDGKACNAGGGALNTDGTFDENGKPSIGGMFMCDPWSWVGLGIPGTYEGGLWELVGDKKYGWRHERDEAIAALYLPEIARSIRSIFYWKRKRTARGQTSSVR